MDLRGRAGFAPGACSNDRTRTCLFDAACGDGSFCRAAPAMIPPNVAGPDRERYFNPMLTVHWNGDRDEVEDFEHTYRELLGAGDCDGVEDILDACLGALVQRSSLTSSDPTDVHGALGPPNRNLRGPRTGKIVGIRLTHLADFVYSLAEFGDWDLAKWVADTIPEVIEPGTWGGAEGWVVRYHAAKRLLIVRHTPAVQGRVAPGRDEAAAA